MAILRGIGCDLAGPRSEDKWTMPVDLKTQETEQDTELDDDSKTRRCLVCADSFLSAWAGERICRKCKSSSTWRTG